MHNYRIHSLLIGALFLLTMLVGMVDAYFAAPTIKNASGQYEHINAEILLGAFAVMIMALGIVFIAVLFYPVIKKQSECIALTYLSFRVIECILLIGGSLCYFYILCVGDLATDKSSGLAIPLWHVDLAVEIKNASYQIAMIILSLGSILLCCSLYLSLIVPRWLSLWGGVGYICLFLSAILDLCGWIDTTHWTGALLYIPGGLWEIAGLPIWLLAKGFYFLEDTKQVDSLGSS